jgi:hypothetical protein
MNGGSAHNKLRILGKESLKGKPTLIKNRAIKTGKRVNAPPFPSKTIEMGPAY